MSICHFSFERFVEQVWREVFQKIMDEPTFRGMKGEFGRTRLATFILAGRIMVTFSRGRVGRPDYTQVTYITEDRDRTGAKFGLQSYDGNYAEHREMIDEVIRTWTSRHTSSYRDGFAGDKTVSII